MENNGMGVITEVCREIQQFISSRGVRGISVVPVSPHEVRLEGDTKTFYHQQVAQEAAKRLLSDLSSGVRLDVAVRVHY